MMLLQWLERLRVSEVKGILVESEGGHASTPTTPIPGLHIILEELPQDFRVTVEIAKVRNQIPMR